MKGLYIRATQKCYIRTRTVQLGETKEEKNREVKRKIEQWKGRKGWCSYFLWPLPLGETA